MNVSNLGKIEMDSSVESSSFTVTKDHLDLISHSKREIGVFFKKLSAWSEVREESQRQFCDIVSSYNASVSKGINDLITGFCDIQTKLSLVTNEKNELIAQIDKLNGEIKALSAQLFTLQSLQEFGELSDELYDLQPLNEPGENREQSADSSDIEVLDSENEKVVEHSVLNKYRVTGRWSGDAISWSGRVF